MRQTCRHSPGWVDASGAQRLSRPFGSVTSQRLRASRPCRPLYDKAAELDTHLVSMGQRPINPQRPQSERKTAAQMSMEFTTSAMTDRFQASDNFTLRNLDPFRPEAISRKTTSSILTSTAVKPTSRHPAPEPAHGPD